MSPYDIDADISTLVFLFDALCLVIVFTFAGAIADWRAGRGS